VAGGRLTTGASHMITHQNGLLPVTGRPDLIPLPHNNREWERLRRELLRRIIDREMRRQAVRGGAR